MTNLATRPHASTPSLKRNAGFTMTELLVTIAIVAVLAGLTEAAMPSLIASSRAKSVASDLMVSFSKARSLAITRNTSVTVVPGANGWAGGWQVVDCGTNNVLDNHAVTSATSVSGPTASVVYTPSGRLQAGSTLPTFVVAGQAGSNTTSYRCLSIELSGRPYMKTGQSC